MNRSIRSYHYARSLLILMAILLYIFAGITLIRVDHNHEMAVIYGLYSLLMVLDASLVLASGLWIKYKMIYWLAIVVLALNIILTIFDQFGLIDLFYVLLNGYTLNFLIVHRNDIIDASPMPKTPVHPS